MFARLIRVAVRLAVLAALGYVIYRLIGGDEGETAPGSPPPTRSRTAPTRRPGAGTAPRGAERPRGQPTQPGTPSVRSIAVGEVDPGARKWVEPDEDGSCPASHPVKAKVESGIFHVPEGRHYERTKADRCYQDASRAEADGLRRSKQ